MHLKTHSYFVKFAFAFCLGGLILGVLFFVIKSPKTTGDIYLSLAGQHLFSGDVAAAEDAIRMSLQSNPSSIKAWHMLAEILKQRGDHYGAKQSLNIVAKIQTGPNAAPVYATPANLRLSFLTPYPQDIQ